MRKRSSSFRTSRGVRWCQVLALGLLVLPEASAQCSVLKKDRVFHTESIGVLYNDRVPPRIVAKAVKMWNRCAALGYAVPVLVDRDPQEVNLVVLYRNPTTASMRAGLVCGDIRGRVISLYSHALDEASGPIPCGSEGRNLAHEIGHYLGLDHPPESPGCRNHVMSRITPWNELTRRVDAETCRALSRAQGWSENEER